MKTLVGGGVAAALGLIGLGIWWAEFLMVLAGIVPVMLLLGGTLAIYLGFDELKDSWKKEPDETVVEKEGEVEKYRQEIDDLKKEIKDLKTD